jgi:hypothetical protein
LKEKAYKYGKMIYQQLNCIQLIDRPLSECKCVPKNMLCSVKRSACKLPHILTGRDSYLIDSVVTLDMQTKFYEIQYGRKSYASGNKYAKTINQYYIQDDYLYVLPNEDNQYIEIVQMFAIFEDMVIPQSFKDCSCNGTTEDCTSPLDLEFLIDPELYEPLIQIAYQELFLFLRMKEDRQNSNAQDNSQQQDTEDSDTR